MLSRFKSPHPAFHQILLSFFLNCTVNVQCAFEETEAALLMLEDMVETQELREKQLDHRFQLALYQEKRASELQDLKG